MNGYFTMTLSLHLGGGVFSTLYPMDIPLWLDPLNLVSAKVTWL